MRLIHFTFIFLSAFYFSCQAKTVTSFFDFDTTVRVDFVLAGNQNLRDGYIAELSQYEGGNYNENTVVSPFDYGEYRALMIDEISLDTIFRKSFSTLFEEWQSTEEAKTKKRAFEQTLLLPKPLINVMLIIESRDKKGGYYALIEEKINENSSFKVKKKTNYEYRILNNENVIDCSLNFLFIAEGYAENEKEKFFNDANKISNSLFDFIPYKKYKNRITFSAIASVSEDSGVTEPSKNIWKNTIVNSSFDTFGVDRYLESLSCWKIYDIATSLPHNHIIVLVNSDKYGGGGVYNHFSILTSQNRNSHLVFIHEIGHGFAGLGDEYEDGDSFDEEIIISRKFEPASPNLTTLVNFDSKWKGKIDVNVPIPTPKTAQYKNVIGVFEGGGYSSKGVYRPSQNCLMRELGAKSFCEVCEDVIEKTILFYTEP